MNKHFAPFTPDAFYSQTGLQAYENEAVYIRWVNTQINYANYQAMREVADALKEIKSLLQNPEMSNSGNFPLRK